jgi:flagellar basal-body rod modification protein FlgD
MAVMGIKTGVKAWSDSPQNEIQKPEKLKMIGADVAAKSADENIGDMLNKVADPNWVDPSKKFRAVGKDKLDKDAFMKLMLAQMKNQDPTNPMQSHEMAAQLAQFTSVEQLMNMNQTLDSMKESQKPMESFQALNFLGKMVAGDSAKLVRAKGDTSHEFNFELPDNAQEVSIKIRNSRGEIVRKMDLKEMKKGNNTWVWNGQNDQAQAQAAGEYQFFVEANSSAGKKLSVKTDFEGLITGVNYTPEGPVLLVGSQSVKLKDVKKIVDPNVKSQNKTGPDLKNNMQQQQTENVARAGDAETQLPSNVLDQVGMSNELMNRVEKEIK